MASEDDEITLETYDKHQIKVPKKIAIRSAIIHMMIEGEYKTMLQRNH
jgi:hypothetical protein